MRGSLRRRRRSAPTTRSSRASSVVEPSFYDPPAVLGPCALDHMQLFTRQLLRGRSAHLRLESYSRTNVEPVAD